MSGYRNLSGVLALTTVILGVAILVRSNGSAGYLIGVLFIAAGAGRLYLMRRKG